MICYHIERPEVSSGLRRTYHKKLEVFCVEQPEAQVNNYSNAPYFTGFTAWAVYVYNNKKSTWVKKPSSKYFRYHIPANNIFDTAELSKPCLYSSLEAACVAKILLIERMAESYKKALKELEESLQRNVPDVQKPFDQLLETHPDLFV